MKLMADESPESGVEGEGRGELHQGRDICGGEETGGRHVRDFAAHGESSR